MQKLAENRDHLILLDVMMPKMDGTKHAEIREKRNIPVILVSAKSEDTDKIIGLNMGADDYITKPYNPLELLARVKSRCGAIRRWEILRDRTAMSLQLARCSLTPKKKSLLWTGSL